MEPEERHSPAYYARHEHMSKNDATISLAPKQERFCVLYVGECNGNATAAYQAAYGCKYEVAKANASRLLTNANVRWRLGTLMAECGLTDAVVDFELRKTVLQDDNLSVKVRAIAEYNRIRRRGDKVEPVGMSLSEMLDEAYKRINKK